METVTYTEMDYNEWDDLVREYFPKISKDYTIVAEEELSNDSTWTNLQKKGDLEIWIAENADVLAEWFQGKTRSYHTYEFHEFFVNAGVIPEGNLLVKISW